MLCVNTLNTPGCCAAPVALTKDLKVQRGDLPPTNLSPLFTIYAQTYQLLLPLFEKYLRLLLSDGGECNPFLSLWPRTTQTTFFFPVPILSSLCHMPAFSFPPSTNLFISIWLSVDFYKMSDCSLLFFVFLCITRAVIDQVNMIRADSDLSLWELTATPLHKIKYSLKLYISINYCRVSAMCILSQISECSPSTNINILKVRQTTPTHKGIDRPLL